MKKYIKNILLGLAACIAVTACQDMDLYPKDELSDQQFWNSPADYMKACNYLYLRLDSTDQVLADRNSDIAYGLQSNTESNGFYIAENTDGTWTNEFSYIRDANKIIEKAEIYPDEFTDIERYIAEARFFRAYFHWRLMKRFNDIPIYTKVLDTESPELYAGRESRVKVEDFILSELEAVYSKLPLESELSVDEKGRLTQGAVLAFKARVALFAGTWAKYHNHRSDYEQLLEQAIKAADMVRRSGEYHLFAYGEESYRRLFIEEGNDAPEAILSRRYAKDIRMHSLAHSVYWGNQGAPTKKLADMYLCKSTGLPIDKSNSGFQGYQTMTDEFIDRDPRMKQTFLIPGTVYQSPQEGILTAAPGFVTRPESRTGYMLWKFMGEEQTGVNSSYYDLHLIRYPEVLLILAEATFEKEGSISDELLNNTINVIRSREGVEMPPLTNQFVQANRLDMRTEIRRERTVELAFEGFRRDDLRRWATAEQELAADLKGIKYKGTEYEALDVLNEGNPGLTDADGFLIIEANRIFTAPKHYYFSLPLNEVYLNPNLLPNNPGW